MTGSWRSREELAHRHHPRTHKVVDFTELPDLAREKTQFPKKTLESRVRNDAQLSGEFAMRRLDAFERCAVVLAERSRQQTLEPVGDSRKSGMNDCRT